MTWRTTHELRCDACGRTARVPPEMGVYRKRVVSYVIDKLGWYSDTFGVVCVCLECRDKGEFFDLLGSEAGR